MADFNGIINDIEKGSIAPVYLLDGDEPFYTDLILEKLEALVPEEEKDFNLVTFYGKEAETQAVVGAARQFPMFGNRLFVILREAGQMKDLDELTNYILSPQSSTVLIIDHRNKKVDGRSKLSKQIKKNGVYFTSSKLKENQIPEWIIQFCKSRNSKIQQQEAFMLAAYLGEDLQKIANELEKIWVNKDDEGTDITSEKIEKYIGINRHYNLYELPNVLFEKNTSKLAHMLNYFSANQDSAPINAFIALFFNFLQKIYLAQAVPQNFTKDKQLGIWTMHRKIATRYTAFQIHQCIAVLEEFSHKAVGIESNSRNNLLQEMVGKIQTIIR